MRQTATTDTEPENVDGTQSGSAEPAKYTWEFQGIPEIPGIFFRKEVLDDFTSMGRWG